jgi:phosphoglycolate phosphatase-like HAD superfamily hydrolase
MASEKSVIRLFITDLDNTLYDWISVFVPAFYAMIKIACQILAVDEQLLLDELKLVHQRYHNSEQPFALLETPTVHRRFPALSPLQKKLLLKKAFDAFEEVREERLHPYPGVRETLGLIRSAGCPVLGYTEAVPENSLFRLFLLKLLNEVDFLYAPRSHGTDHPDRDHPRKLDPYRYKIRYLPAGHRKPDPTVLKDICASHHQDPVSVLYLGDSITRDVAMAKVAGIHSVWARYGTAYSLDDWQKLVRITHWTKEDVDREEELSKRFGNVQADVKIDSFPQLLEYFSFGSPSKNSL